MVDFAGFTQWFLEWSNSVASTWGYLGIFFISIIANATIILPFPLFLVVFAAGAFLNPWLVGLSAGLGSAIGEFTAYGVGIGSREALKSNYKKWVKKVEKWAEKSGLFPLVVLFAATPLPADVIGIFCGMARYDIRKFFLGMFIGKTIMSVALAWGGFYGLGWVLSLFTLG